MLAVRLAVLHYPTFHEERHAGLKAALAHLDMRLLYLHETGCGGSHRYVVEERLRQLCDYEEIDWIVTLGGTWPAPGPSPAAQVPLATDSVLERSLPGIPEAMRSGARDEFPHVALDAGIAGVRGMTFLLNLPAETRLLPAYVKALEPFLPTLFQALREDASDDHEPEEIAAGAEASAPAAGRLRGDEFAAFLDRKKDRRRQD